MSSMSTGPSQSPSEGPKQDQVSDAVMQQEVAAFSKALRSKRLMPLLLKNLETSLSELRMAPVIISSLEEKGIYNIENLLMLKLKDLQDVPQIGNKRIIEIFKKLHGYIKGLADAA
jgi:DNA-directed RNA polymerase alpha subunit